MFRQYCGLVKALLALTQCINNFYEVTRLSRLKRQLYIPIHANYLFCINFVNDYFF